ncbi:MAG TPA: hypothetical protein DCP92_06080 [Nitrospiraceae bacterium]|nr:hypothetical protein [Nitrospiraceae bacterium]
MVKKVKRLTIAGIECAQEVFMSCPYFKKGYFGVCIASESRYIPNIVKMESYCFKEHYRLCPHLAKYIPENAVGRDARDSSHEGTNR